MTIRGLHVHLANERGFHVSFWFDDPQQAVGFRNAIESACRQYRVTGSVVGSYPAEMTAQVYARFGVPEHLREAEDIIRRAASALQPNGKATES